MYIRTGVKRKRQIYLPLQMFCNLRNKDQAVNNNQYNVVEEHKLIFLSMDLKYSENYIMRN